MTTKGPESTAGTPEGEIRPQKSIEELLEALSSVELQTLPGKGVRRSEYSLKQLAKDKPLVKRRKRKKYKVRKDSYLRKKRMRNSRYANRVLLDRDKCYGHYKRKYGSRWQITPEEWSAIWDTCPLEGVSPVVSAIYPGGVLTKYSVVIRPRQEKKLKAAIYDGEEQEIYDLMHM